MELSLRNKHFIFLKKMAFMTTNNNSNISLLRLREVISRTGIPRSTLYKMISTGNFPAQIKISTKSVAWSSVAIDQWIDSLIPDNNTVH